MKRRKFLGLPFVIRAAASTQLVRTPAEAAAAVRAASPGDEVVLADGEWRDADLALQGAGTAEAPLRVRAETPGGVRLTGRSRLRIGGACVSVEGLFFDRCSYPGDLVQFRISSTTLARNCRLADCVILDCNPDDLELNTKWVGIYGTANEVTTCYLAGKRNIGTTLVVWVIPDAGRHHIHRNWFGPRPVLGVNGGETIRVGDSQTSMLDCFTTVEDNYFDRCDGEVEIISNKSCGNVYQSNCFEACEGTLTLRHGNRCRVEGNFFFGAGARQAGGVRIIGEDNTVINNYMEGLRGTGFRAALSVVNGLPNSPLEGYFQVKRAVAAFNTMLDCAEPIIVGTNGGNRLLVLPPEDVVVANNLVVPGRELGDNWTRAEDGVLRPSSLNVADDAAAVVTHDIDGQARRSPRMPGCDEIVEGERVRWKWDGRTAGPEWWRHRLQRSTGGA